MNLNSSHSPLLRRLGISLVAVSLCGIVPSALATAAPSAPAQGSESLQQKARKIAEQIDAMQERSLVLEADFEQAQIELEGLKQQIGTNQELVSVAQANYEKNRSDAVRYAVNAFTGQSGEDNLSIDLDNVVDGSRRRVYLTAMHGDRRATVDQLAASRKDLDERQNVLSSAQEKAELKSREIQSAKDGYDKTIAEQRALLESTQGELKKALVEEQAKLDAEREAKVQADAQAAAAAAAAARRPAAVTVSRPVVSGGASTTSPSTNGGSGAAGTTAAPAQSVVTPTPVAPPPAAAGPPTSGGSGAVAVALAQQGKPYVWAADGPDSFDCSGLVIYAYAHAGRPGLPHSSRELRSMSRSLSADQLQPGDLVFGGSPIHHVGIYIGNGQMVHAPHSGDVVKVSSMYGTSKPVSFGRLP